ncbi:MAG TPA: hypothetical protein VNQ56_07720 [Pseudolabrys sp.]|nr:hypothetical protein [Pseudolabrys sp.]
MVKRGIIATTGDAVIGIAEAVVGLAGNAVVRTRGQVGTGKQPRGRKASAAAVARVKKRAGKLIARAREGVAAAKRSQPKATRANKDRSAGAVSRKTRNAGRSRSNTQPAKRGAAKPARNGRTGRRAIAPDTARKAGGKARGKTRG